MTTRVSLQTQNPTLVLPQVRRGILDGSTSRISVLADRGVYELFLINAPWSVERHSH